MNRKIYQPDRPDIFINTDWGIPKDQLSKAEAKERGLRLYKDHWVTLAEKALLHSNHIAYRRILNISGLLIVFPGAILLYILTVSLPGLTSFDLTSLLPLLLTILFCAISIRVGFGLRRFQNWARIILTVLSSMPFILGVALWIYASGQAGGTDEFVRGYAWLIWLVTLPLIPIYYLNNRAARKIFG